MINLDVQILGKIIKLQVNPQDILDDIIKKALGQLQIENNNDIRPIVYVKDFQADLQSNIKSSLEKVNGSSEIQVTLTKNFTISFQHNLFGQLQFQCNQFGPISELQKSIIRQISRKFQSLQFEIKILVNGSQHDPKTFWYSLGKNPNIKFIIETTIQINNQGKIEPLTIDASWSVQQVISSIQQQKNLQDNILLMYKDQELLPEDQIIKEKIPANAVYSVQLQQNVKFRIRQVGAQAIQEIEINNQEPISNLENLIQEKLQLTLKQKVVLKFGENYLDPKKTVKQEMIPYNSILTYEIVELQKIQLQLINIQNQQPIIHEVDPQVPLKFIEPLLSQGVQNLKEIKFFLNNKELTDKNQRLDQLGLKRNQPLNYEIKLNEPPPQPPKKVEELNITFLNTYTNNKSAFYVGGDRLISENFEKVIKNERFSQIQDYKITYDHADLNINQSYEKANIQNQSIISYYCLLRQIRYIYQQGVFEFDARITQKLSDLEAQWRQKHNIPNNFTIFHSKFEHLRDKAVEQIGFLDQLEFIKPKIVAIKNPQPMKILNFKILIQELEMTIFQEIPANNQIMGLADCLRHKLSLPKSSRIVFFLGQDILPDNKSLDSIMDGQNIDTLSARVLDNISVLFENQQSKQQTKQVVKIAETLKQTATLLKLENAQFSYNNQIIKQMDLSYEQLLITHNETIYYVLQNVNQAPPQQQIYQQPPVEAQKQQVLQPPVEQVPQPPVEIPKQRVQQPPVEVLKQKIQNDEDDEENQIHAPPESQELNPQVEQKQPIPEQNVKEAQQPQVNQSQVKQPNLVIIVNVGGKFFKLSVEPTTTVKELNQNLHEQVSFKKNLQSNQFLYFNSHRLRDEVELQTLVKANEELRLDYLYDSQAQKY